MIAAWTAVGLSAVGLMQALAGAVLVEQILSFAPPMLGRPGQTMPPGSASWARP